MSSKHNKKGSPYKDRPKRTVTGAAAVTAPSQPSAVPPASSSASGAPASAVNVNAPLRKTSGTVAAAERVMDALFDEDVKRVPLTRTKLRALHAYAADIYNRIKIKGASDEPLPQDLCELLDYVRIRYLYEAGRDPGVRVLVDQAHLNDRLKAVHTYRDCLNFCRFMEALVALQRYRSALGGYAEED